MRTRAQKHCEVGLSAREIAFTKYEGLGNDFIIVDSDTALDVEQAVALCDRHLGIGADGILFVGDASKPSMRVVNADGTSPEMCGNGLRCVAFHIVRSATEKGSTQPRTQELVVDTDAGLHRCSVELHTDLQASVEIEMRAPSFNPTDIPIRSGHPIIEESLELAARGLGDLQRPRGTSIVGTAVSMGNPHFVIFEPVAVDEREILARTIQAHPIFPDGVNIGFAHDLVSSRSTGRVDSISLSVFERGVGFTQACGTGACATVAALAATKRVHVGDVVRVRLPGGELDITYRGPNERMRMRGPARRVFSGTFRLSS